MTVLTGLTTAEVQERRDRGLANDIPDDTGRSLSNILRVNVFTLFNAVAGGCSVLLLMLGAWQDALFGVFLIANTLIGVVQEFRANRTLRRLAVLNAPRALVLRGGSTVECSVGDVVLDDLLVLRPGEQLTADAVLVSGREIEIDQSLLSGEADPVGAEVGDELLSGSTVLSGSGLAQVVRVGVDSYAARITSQARQFSPVSSELRESIGRVIRWISIGLIPAGWILLNGQMQSAGGWETALASGAWRDAVIAAVGGLIAMVPQGLVFMTSVALAVGAVKLTRRRVLVHEIASVEGLARVDMLCVDKTGTLTEGSLSLDRVEPVNRPPLGWDRALGWFATDSASNATAQAIGAGFHTAGGDIVHPDSTVPFSSRYKWSAAYFSDERLPGLWVLGGTDVVLSRSGADAAAILAHANSLTAAGFRTMVLAHSRTGVGLTEHGETPLLPETLEAAALIVLREKIRVDAAETIRYFGRQGVRLCVISGDHPQTVAAIARGAGIPGADVAVDARFLPSDPADLADAIRAERIFGRVTPEQKRDLVLAFQSLGYTVAMTGDGVNDALALKHADLGIAMGSGSPATRAVANLVLLDGAFARLPGILGEGRRVIANVERLSRLFLTKTTYAILLGVAYGALLLPYPFLPRHLSVVDGLTIGLPALVLALLPNDRVYQPGFLRRALRFCLPSGAIVAVSVAGVAAYADSAAGVSVSEVQTTAVITLTLSALWVLVVLVRPFTLATVGVVVAAYAGLLVVLSVPLITDFLELTIPPGELLVAAIASSACASLLVEMVHRRTRR
ncbi:MAG: HAD-IC family P-type ATPase [Mycetocola sp.]